MSRNFKTEACIYCLSRRSTRAGDHVFARGFFMKDRRDELPKVPACDRCNGEKARLEHYLASVLPFAGRHPDARRNLHDNVPSRLSQNLRLHRALGEHLQCSVAQGHADQFLPTLSIPFEGQHLMRLFQFVVKGLVFHHWGATLGDEHGIRVMAMTSTGQDVFAGFLGMRARRHVIADLGNGTFCYEGKQGSYPELTVWRISIYGGLVMTDDSDTSHEVATGIGAVTASKEFLARPAVFRLLG